MTELPAASLTTPAGWHSRTPGPASVSITYAGFVARPGSGRSAPTRMNAAPRIVMVIRSLPALQLPRS